jgi:methionyl-tRNA synthetase
VESELPGRVDAALRVGDFRAATGALWSEVDRGNRLIEATQPWKLADPGPVLAEVLGLCHLLTGELRPFLPSGAKRLAGQLRCDEPPRPVFPRLGAAAPTVRPDR